MAMQPVEIGNLRFYTTEPTIDRPYKHFAVICMLCEHEWAMPEGSGHREGEGFPCPSCGHALGFPGEVLVMEVIHP